MGIPNLEDTLISLHEDFETNDKLQDKVYELQDKLDKIKEYIVDKKDIYKDMTFDFDFNTILEIIESEWRE